MNRKAIIPGKVQRVWTNNPNEECYLYHSALLNISFCIDGYIIEDETRDDLFDDILTGPILVEFYDEADSYYGDLKIGNITEDTNVILEKLLK